MIIEPSGVAAVELIGPESAEFCIALRELLDDEPDDLLRPALQCSVIVRNNASRPIALLGIRFDMIAESGKPYSVVHYADTLRNPEKAVLKPGATRFVCAETAWTRLVLDWQAGPGTCEPRARMNLENLRRAREIRASLDCVAFADGQFAGRDSFGAFERFAVERETETALLNEVPGLLERQAECVERALAIESETSVSGGRDAAPMARRTLARQLHAAWRSGGAVELRRRAREYRIRMMLWRAVR